MPAVCVRLLALAAVLVLGAPLGAGRAATTGRLSVEFAQGEQLVTVQRSGSTPQDALTALLRGPTPAEAGRQIRTYIPTGTPVRSLTVTGTTATVDLGARFVEGNAPDPLDARLAQLVDTLTADPGVNAVRVLIEGGVPLGLFPGIDATRPLTSQALATPSVPVPKPTPTPPGPVQPSLRQTQQRLADLGYLPQSAVDGVAGPATTVGVIAFQKWQGLTRDGVVGPQTQAALTTATRPTPTTQGSPGRRVEVLVDRQLVLAIQDNEVVRAIHVSTGKPSTPTPTGSFQVYAKYPRWWSTPFQEWLLWAAPFVGGVALHQFPDVPVEAASHGCVRVTQYDAPWLYGFVSVGTPVRVLGASR
jgi:lipoprotein-anchoring transpeptidase ErfK/SrfK